MPFTNERYELLSEPVTMRYAPGQKALALSIGESIERADKLLSQLLALKTPAMEILLVAPQDWKFVPHEEPEALPAGEAANEEPDLLLPYWTDVTEPPSLVIPTQLDPIMGHNSPQKLAFLVFHELAHAFLEADPRPWPLESPLWADEWQLQFAALWLAQQIFDVRGVVMVDLHDTFAEIFQPEPDGKTPITVRGFDWYEDTTPRDYLEFTLLLERFADDLLSHYDAMILPRFLDSYREEFVLLSDDVTEKLAEVLGEGGIGWLENLDYF
jgi:hypothetical protein